MEPHSSTVMKSHSRVDAKKSKTQLKFKNQTNLAIYEEETRRANTASVIAVVGD